MLIIFCSITWTNTRIRLTNCIIAILIRLYDFCDKNIANIFSEYWLSNSWKWYKDWFFNVLQNDHPILHPEMWSWVSSLLSLKIKSISDIIDDHCSQLPRQFSWFKSHNSFFRISITQKINTPVPNKAVVYDNVFLMNRRLLNNRNR